MSTHALTVKQLHDLEITERIASVFSLLGTSFILFTFVYSPAFRKPVNRLIFYASWGNTLMNIATLMSQSGIRAGRDSHLCQFQGFLIQMFLPADALWNLAMAINVYLTLFKKYNAHQLKALEWRYHIMCYGVTFFVALVYLFIETPERGRMYGPATLWCWVDVKWQDFRIALVYAPAWCCITASFIIYVLAGREIFAKRQQLRAFSNPASRPTKIEKIQNPFTSFKTTEIQVTRELTTMASPNMSKAYLSPNVNNAETEYFDRSSVPSRSTSTKGYDQYSVTIGSSPMSPSFQAPQIAPARATIIQQRTNRAAMEANTAAWGYTKVALLFFISLLVTWVPASINRVYSLVHPELVSVGFTYASGIVLPLMGFWNSVIYITTSRAAVRMLFSGKLSGSGAAARASAGFIRRPSVNRRRTGSQSDSVAGLKPKGVGSGYNQV